MTPADDLREIGMGKLWTIAAVAVPVLSGLMTPWKAISEAEGSGRVILASVAGYTFPLTLGFAVVSYLTLKGYFRNSNPYALSAIVALILYGAGEVAKDLGLGRLPDYSGANVTAFGPFNALMTVLKAYLNTYTWGLMLSSLIVGFVFAVQIERWIHSRSGS